ncbi:hypothetical protein NM688_g2013 [Phlebia brevispora]|uniref:Uncharacterized protein n=1 Tax=Phlebia brevispora TaxID=194682 RepID=A0ACC1TA25_9APHY|nr:hypothetical protein NM688_g2013 [Phlebia brevispora]
MYDDMDLDEPYGPPGGDSFEDVTGLFAGAGKDMAQEELLFAESFGLMDAMSAFEIGEPRMDSGMAIDHDVWDRFDPLSPLLPEELCWMLDRTFACEMEWHAGNTLSQSVFTFLYVHQLADINPDLLPPGYPLQKDPRRPSELITLVLRTAVFGLLKSCDLVWRELAKKRVYDIEDWQSDKCDVTLLEGVPVDLVLRKLDESCTWLRHSSLPVPERDALCDRLLLRKSLLQLFKLNTPEELDELRPLITIARSILRRIQTQPIVSPASDSPALNAFDPRVIRRLHTVVPIRVLELPTQDVVWQSIGQLLDGWEHISHLREVHSLWGWKIAGSLDVWGPERKLQYPYIRSLTQGVFCDRNAVLGEYPVTWLVEQFFEDTLGIPYRAILPAIVEDTTQWTARDVETQIIRTTVVYIKTFWYNPPRRRRALMRSVADWQLLHEGLLTVSSHIVLQDQNSAMIAFALPKAAVIWKLTVIREIILSGFQQQLYAPHERSVAYWYLAHVVEQHLDVLETLRSFMHHGSAAYHEMQHQSQFLSALQLMAICLSAMTAADLTQSMDRMALNFGRRYKWLPTDEAGLLLLSLPPFGRFPRDLKTISDDGTFLPQEYLRLARDMLHSLSNFGTRTLCDPQQREERRKSVRDLASVAESLMSSLSKPKKSMRLEWDPEYHPWFPRYNPIPFPLYAHMVGPEWLAIEMPRVRALSQLIVFVSCLHLLPRPRTTGSNIFISVLMSSSKVLKRKAATGSSVRASSYHTPVTYEASEPIHALRRSKRVKVKEEVAEGSSSGHVCEAQELSVKKVDVVAKVTAVKKPKKDVSPRKAKAIPQSLAVPHPAPPNWREVYDKIKDMRQSIVAPVDTMGCDQAQFGETDPRNRRFATLVSLMLSSQTKDEVTDAAVAKLREAVGGSLSVDAILKADESKISEAIAKVGFWRRKTQYIKQAAQKLHDEFDSEVPKTVDELCSLPGVGPKMAFLALQVAWNINVGIGVDVHVHRITNRLGWHKPPTKNPEETRLNLQSWLPVELHPEINHLLVGFGQTICAPVGPRCDQCELSNGLCPSAKKAPKKTQRRAKTVISTAGGPQIEIAVEKTTTTESVTSPSPDAPDTES